MFSSTDKATALKVCTKIPPISHKYQTQISTHKPPIYSIDVEPLHRLFPLYPGIDYRIMRDVQSSNAHFC